MSFQDIIDSAPQVVKDMLIKDKQLTELLEAVYLSGRSDMRIEIVKHLMRSSTVDKKFV